jgi:hypothetical protein
MKTKTLAFVAILTFARALPAGEGAEWVDLFDGKTLEGWEQLNGTAPYEVKDGAIVGQTAAGSPNSFLCTEKLYGDFELEFEVKCDTGLNSGVQIRSRQKSTADTGSEAEGKKNNQEGRVFGPQVEIEAGPGQAGYVYGEATGLKWLSEEPQSKDPEVKQHSHFKNDEWNQFRVIAKGPRIQTFINGQEIEDLTHEEIYGTHPEGFIGLQVHGIGQREVSFSVAWRNIRIRELK